MREITYDLVRRATGARRPQDSDISFTLKQDADGRLAFVSADKLSEVTGCPECCPKYIDYIEWRETAAVVPDPASTCRTCAGYRLIMTYRPITKEQVADKLLGYVQLPTHEEATK